MKYCDICGNRLATDTHHLLSGRGIRNLADEDGLILSLCPECHTMGSQALHKNNTAATLSKMLGQALYERDQVAKGKTIDESRQLFMRRYGRNWL